MKVIRRFFHDESNTQLTLFQDKQLEELRQKLEQQKKPKVSGLKKE
jgi:hypothetical protein